MYNLEGILPIPCHHAKKRPLVLKLQNTYNLFIYIPKKGQILPSEFKENYILHSSSEYCALPKKLDLVRQHKQ